MSLKANLQSLLEQKKWSLSRLAKESGVSKSTLHGWARGSETVSLKHLKAVATALDTSVHTLAYGEADPREVQAREILSDIFRGDVRVILQRIEKHEGRKL